MGSPQVSKEAQSTSYEKHFGSRADNNQQRSQDHQFHFFSVRYHLISSLTA
jgi:hypothetical protein